MSNEMNDYIKELKQLKSLNLLPEDQIEELDHLILLMESMDKRTEEVDYGDFKIPIKFVNTSKNEDPIYAKEGDSGFDFRAELTEVGGKYHMKPFERALIPTGLYFELPNGYELQVRPRSGLSFKTGLMAILGTVDTGYRGEVKVILVNLSDKECIIEQGERIAQGVVMPRVSSDFGKLIKLESTEELSQTERGESGFGSTGRK